MLSPETRTIQTKLGEYCRSGILPELPGIQRDHIRHYRRLVFNAIRNTIRQAFPIAQRVIKKELFREFINEFFKLHDAKTSQIWKLPGEFYAYALEAKWAEKHSLPWLNDLLLFEWTELKVHTMPDGDVTEFLSKGELSFDKLVFNPDYEIIRLEFPVHLLPVKEVEEKNGNYFVLVFRNQKNGRVSFVNLSIFYAFLIQRLQEVELTLKQVLNEAYELFNISDRSNYPETTESFFLDLQRQGFLLGYLKNEE